jgi:hypothetical protein
LLVVSVAKGASRHDWDDDHAVDILKGIRASMSKTSRLLIADIVINTTVGSSKLMSAPAPLPANWGLHTRFNRQLDINVLTFLNGTERTPVQFGALAARAELELVKIWECRGCLCITELRLPS